MEYIPQREINRKMEERGAVAAGVLPAFLRVYYREKDHEPPIVNKAARLDRLTIEFVNWFLDLIENSDDEKMHGYTRSSLDVAVRQEKTKEGKYIWVYAGGAVTRSWSG